MNTPVNATTTFFAELLGWKKLKVNTTKIAVCALPYSDWAPKFKVIPDALGAKVKITLWPLPPRGEPKSVICQLWQAQHKGSGGVSFNSVAAEKLGLKPEDRVKVVCEWVE